MLKFPFLAMAGLAVMVATSDVAAQEPTPTIPDTTRPVPPTPTPTPTPEPVPDPMPPTPTPEPLPTDPTAPPAAADFPLEDVNADTTTIIGRLQADGRFTTLVQALRQTGVDQQLSMAGPVTLFAPTDEAFAELSEEDSMELMQDSTKLRELLLHHVVTGSITSDEVMDSTEVETLAGDSLSVRSEAGEVMVEDASVVQADLTAGESVVHAVDHVIIKRDKEAKRDYMPPAAPPTVPPFR